MPDAGRAAWALSLLMQTHASVCDIGTRFRQVVEGETRLRQADAPRPSAPPLRRPASCRPRRPNPRLASASPHGTPRLTAHAAAVERVARGGHRQPETAAPDRGMGPLAYATPVGACAHESCHTGDCGSDAGAGQLQAAARASRRQGGGLFKGWLGP